MSAEDEEHVMEEEEDYTLSNSGVVEKYKMAGTFSSTALKAILAEIKVGALVCRNKPTNSLYRFQIIKKKKKSVNKGRI